jgi:hypothetical protein
VHTPVVRDMKAVIYVDRDDYKTIEDEERNKFVKGVLAQIGIPLDEVWPDTSLTTEQKVALRHLLGKYDVFLAGKEGNTEIYVSGELVGQWKKPRYRLRIDDSEIDPAKKTFLEMTIECSSVFDEDDLLGENDEEENEQ